MNVLSYPPILDAISLVQLKNQVENFHPVGRNAWIGIYDEPENTIEKYIQDSFDFLLKDSPILTGKPVGFEWWIENLDGHNTIKLHTNHDETYLTESNGKVKYPLLSTETYLTNHPDPTTILNTKRGKYYEEYKNNPPTETVFSAPEKSKFLVSDPRYVRGVFGRCSTRPVLCYDVWDYKPKNLNRVGILTNIVDCRFYKQKPRLPVQWLGQTRKQRLTLGNKTFFNRYPSGYNAGETWKVTQ